MGELGKRFSEAREEKNITLKQVEADTKIKPRFIEAIEAENFESFPSAPMARGFIRNYADYLELDTEEILALLDGENGSKKGLKLPQGIPFMNLSIVRRQRTLFSADSFITLLIIIALLGSALFYVYIQYIEPAQNRLLALPSVVEYQVGETMATPVLQPTPTPPPTETPTPSPTPSPQYYTGVAVELVVHERSWVQILVDDAKRFEGTLEVGDKPNWAGDKRIAIRAGNGGGIEVFVNGQNMGFMGEEGQVIDQVWEKVDEIPSVESTPTPTPEVNEVNTEEDQG